jgi:hypothetical protein
MTGHYMFTCPVCQSVVDYGCNCPDPQPSDRWDGHPTYEAAMAHAHAPTPPLALVIALVRAKEAVS